MLSDVLLVATAVAMISYIGLRLATARRDEKALRETNRFAQEIIDNAGEGIVVLDSGLKYLLWNRFMEELTGLEAKEVVGKPALDLFPHIREQSVEVLLGRALAG